jgi:hypothetical protein
MQCLHTSVVLTQVPSTPNNYPVHLQDLRAFFAAAAFLEAAAALILGTALFLGGGFLGREEAGTNLEGPCEDAAFCTRRWFSQGQQHVGCSRRGSGTSVVLAGAAARQWFSQGQQHVPSS